LRNLILLLILAPVFALASSFTDSVLIGGSGPADSKAQLDVKSTTKGVLLPRMTTTQQNAITSPTEGLILYDNVLHQLSVYDGVAWQAMFDAGNLTGTVPAGSVPAATTGATGVVFAKNATTHNFVTGITSGTGAITTAQPAFTDISGSVAASQLPNPSSSSLGGVQSAASVSHQWINSISTLGVPSLSQPAFSDISGTASLTTQVTGTLPIANGGTGQTAKQGAFDALSPLTSAGDMLVFASGHNDRVGTVLADVGKAWTSGGGTVPNGWSVLGVAGGGTGFSAYTTGDVLYASGSSALSKLGIGTTGQVLKVSGGVPVWGTASGGTGVNFIVNPDAETDASTWNLYGVAGQNPPGDGSTSVGGPVQSFARTTSTPLTGTGSFLLTHPASNAQGYGVSTDFTIDNASQAKVMNIEFDYQVASGTFAAGSPTTDSDVEIWVYDITNAKLIQPTTYKLSSNSTSPPSHFLANFQTASNSTSYRLIFHFATTATSAFTLKFDTVSVAPSKYTYGTPITDWVTFTPTLTASTTNPTLGSGSVQQGSWRRVGDSIEVEESIVFGTSGTNAGSGNYQLPLPNNLAIDTAKLSAASVRPFLQVALLASGGTGATGNVQFTGTNPQFVLLFVNNTQVTNASPGAWTANDYIKVTYRVPVVGWSSTVQMSDSAPQAVVASRYSLTSNQTGVNPNSTSVKVLFNDSTTSPNFDRQGAFSSGTYTAKFPGIYTITPVVTLSPTNVLANLYQLRVYKNGVFQMVSGATFATAGSQTTITGSPVDLDLKAGDTIDIYLFGAGNNSASTLTILGTTDATFCSVKLTQGPTTIGATESVGALYTGAPPTGTLANTFNTVTYGTRVDDSHLAYSGGTYTVPAPGRYNISAGLGINATYSAGKLADVLIYVNGVALAEGPHVAGGAVTNLFPMVNMTDIKLKAGDLVTIKSFCDATTPTFTSGATVNFFSITRVGL
jgi:hypothetical protein